MPDTVLLSYLLGVASSLSGYAPLAVGELPTLRLMSPPALVEEVCPDEPAQCEKLVAVYDRAREQILVRADLDLHDDADNSFLVHEFVHVLEAREKGDLYQRDCRATLQSEREAYDAQNAYLRQRGRPERHGRMLTHMVCARDQPGGASTMTLEMPPAGPRDERALEVFMQELASPGASAARGR